MKTLATLGVLVLSILSQMRTHALDFGVSNDLWDISQGTTIKANSPFDAAFGSPHPYDARDLFGGHFGDFLPESGDVVFNDNQPAGFIHFVEWQTAAPVTVGSFKLYAAADGNPSYQREIARFRLLAKSVGAPTFDLTLYDVTPARPYSYVDVSQYLLLSASIANVTAMNFRAEFFDVGGTPFGGPRVIELDAFAPVPEPGVATLLLGGVLALSYWRQRKK